MPAKPTLIGPHITLRPIQHSDLDVYTQILQDSEALRLMGTNKTFSREESIRWITTITEHEERVDLAIVPKGVYECQSVLSGTD